MSQQHVYRVLIVEDDQNERTGLARILTDAGYQVCTAESGDKALSFLDEPIDFALTDLQMGDVSGIDLLRHWKLKQPATEFLVMTGHGSTQTAIDATKAGAYHYMTKPLDVDGLLVMLKNMVRQREETLKVHELQKRLDEKCSLSNIIGRSDGMQRVFEIIRRAGQAFSTVLILGESGTGKELVAEAIHQASPRRNGPFIAVNCAAMQPTLVESELFGHEKGAFTGAVERRTGRFEAAHGGTLFIDEIGDFDVSLQVKLLRALESRVITPVGGQKEIKVDTRVLAATSRDIHDMIAKGTFREDLYYRLNVIRVELPPLRQRLEDIPLLVRRFMDRVNQQNGTAVTAIQPQVIDALQHYRWPGNVRELLNIIERMMVLTDKSVIEMTDLPSYICDGSPSPAPAAPPAPATAGVASVTVPAAPAAQASAPGTEAIDAIIATMTLDQLEDRAIAVALNRFNNNRTRAARALGISVRTLQRKLGAKSSPDSEGEVPTEPSASQRAVPLVGTETH